MTPCPTCTVPATPLDEKGRCVTCDAKAEGLLFLHRAQYASIRELMTLLQERGVEAEMERVPPANEVERHHPTWNLYAPAEQHDQARALLLGDWAGLLEGDDAVAAAQRGRDGIDLDAGGDVTCPACGHAFSVTGSGEVECPECGLGLGAPGGGSDR